MANQKLDDRSSELDTFLQYLNGHVKGGRYALVTRPHPPRRDIYRKYVDYLNGYPP